MLRKDENNAVNNSVDIDKDCSLPLLAKEDCSDGSGVPRRLANNDLILQDPSLITNATTLTIALILL